MKNIDFVGIKKMEGLCCFSLLDVNKLKFDTRGDVKLSISNPCPKLSISRKPSEECHFSSL